MSSVTVETCFCPEAALGISQHALEQDTNKFKLPVNVKEKKKQRFCRLKWVRLGRTSTEQMTMILRRKPSCYLSWTWTFLRKWNRSDTSSTLRTKPSWGWLAALPWRRGGCHGNVAAGSCSWPVRWKWEAGSCLKKFREDSAGLCLTCSGGFTFSQF